MENNEELANQIKGLPLTEQIRMLAAIGGDDWENLSTSLQMEARRQKTG